MNKPLQSCLPPLQGLNENEATVHCTDIIVYQVALLLNKSLFVVLDQNDKSHQTAVDAWNTLAQQYIRVVASINHTPHR